MEESIYNLIPEPVVAPQKAPMYHSKHAGTKPPTFSTFGTSGTSKPGYSNPGGLEAAPPGGHHPYQKSFATMGKVGNAIPPSNILKKGTGGGGGAGDAAGKSADAAYTPKPAVRPMPAVPTKEECRQSYKALQKPKETKNFITANAVENILAVPKRAPEQTDWLKKPGFGEVPVYLRKIKKEISDEYEYIRSMQQAQEEQAAPAGMRLLEEEERLQLIKDLKVKWGEVNVHYQQSSVLSLASLDTIGKVKRKEMYEAQLAQIEKDIEKLSKKTVYVRDDDY